MVTSSKILTVSYGTFSCTLEGFDDPFTTLQMVAEYFRKLAAEDRMFGSAPQKPDTETLRRIAAKNSTQEIDAEIDDDGIILRQSDRSAEPDPHQDTVDDILVFDSQRNAETPAPAPGTASPLTFFRSRRYETEPEPAEAEPEPELETVAEQEPEPEETAFEEETLENEEAVHEPEEPEPPKKSVEETLEAIRQNVESAETDAETSPAPDPLILTPDAVVEPEQDLVAETAVEDTAEAKFEAEFEQEQEVETVSEPQAAPEQAAQEPEFQTSLPEEDEAELEADLAAVLAVNEAENAIAAKADAENVNESRVEEERVEEEEEEEAPLTKAQQLQGQSDIDLEEEALDRLLETTQSKMNKPEQQRRLNALDQLKAAVAATEADQKLRKTAISKRKSADEDRGDTADLAGYIIYVRATLRSIGYIGISLVTAIIAACIWVLVDEGILVDASRELKTWIVLIGLSFVLGIGLSWSHVRRAISGQSDMDDLGD